MRLEKNSTKTRPDAAEEELDADEPGCGWRRIRHRRGPMRLKKNSTPTIPDRLKKNSTLTTLKSAADPLLFKLDPRDAAGDELDADEPRESEEELDADEAGESVEELDDELGEEEEEEMR
ncbi:hypothetical protein YC2023_096446 [Brassica napus]